MRNDYMLDKKDTYPDGDSTGNDTTREYELKQIEINMIASSFSGLGSNICQLHK